MKGHQSIRQRLILKDHHPLNWNNRKPVGGSTATSRHLESPKQCDEANHPAPINFHVKTNGHHIPFCKGAPKANQPNHPGTRTHLNATVVPRLTLLSKRSTNPHSA
jgi:hypothetical protein